MKTIEINGGLYTEIPNREYNLLLKLLKTKKDKFLRSSFTPRTDVLARNLIRHHVLGKDENYFYLRNVNINI